MAKLPKLVEVQWLDAWCCGEWMRETDVPHLLATHDQNKVRTVGYLVGKSKRWLIVAACIGTGADGIGQVNLIQKIPRQWVVKVKALR